MNQTRKAWKHTFLSQTWSYFEDSWWCFGLAFLILFESMSPLGSPWIRVTWRSGWTSVSLPAFCDRVNFSRENLYFNLPAIQLAQAPVIKRDNRKDYSASCLQLSVSMPQQNIIKVLIFGFRWFQSYCHRWVKPSPCQCSLPLQTLSVVRIFENLMWICERMTLLQSVF